MHSKSLFFFFFFILVGGELKVDVHVVPCFKFEVHWFWHFVEGFKLVVEFQLRMISKADWVVYVRKRCSNSSLKMQLKWWLLKIRKSCRFERVLVLLCRLDRLLVLFRSPGQWQRAQITTLQVLFCFSWPIYDTNRRQLH